MADPSKAYVTSPLLDRVPRLIHGFGTKGLTEEDFSRIVGARDLRPFIMRQLHSDIVHRVNALPSSPLEGDGVITNVPGLLLVVRTADCLPVLLADEKNRAVGAVHCGWRGTRARVLERAVREMAGAYGSVPGDLIAALGPCIGPCCCEVGPEVRAAFASAGFPAEVFANPPEGQGQGSPPFSNKFFLDLGAANARLLEGLGVKKDHIWIAGACTHCDPNLLSYRRDKSERRRMYNFIGIRPG
jgi:YfiH family protein